MFANQVGNLLKAFSKSVKFTKYKTEIMPYLVKNDNIVGEIKRLYVRFLTF